MHPLKAKSNRVFTSIYSTRRHIRASFSEHPTEIDNTDKSNAKANQPAPFLIGRKEKSRRFENSPKISIADSNEVS
jgi:hypothetical protein